MIGEQPEADFELMAWAGCVTSIWTMSSPTVSFHDLTCIKDLAGWRSVCRVSSTSTPAGGAIRPPLDWSPNIPRPIKPRVTSQASVAPPALDSLPGASTESARALTGHWATSRMRKNDGFSTW